MARGESPYKGHYTVPTIDYSPIERGGAAWGRAFEGIGGAIGGAITEKKNSTTYYKVGIRKVFIYWFW